MSHEISLAGADRLNLSLSSLRRIAIISKMNSVSDKYKEKVAELVAKMTDLSVETVFPLVEIPKNDDHGDYSLPVPKLKLPGNPVSIAADLVNKFIPNESVTGISCIGPFLNFKIDKKALLKEAVIKAMQEKEKYGSTNVGNGSKVVIEFSSPNIAKPFHAGHLRTTIIGNFLKNLYKFQGFSVTALNYLGDWGKQYGLLAIGFIKFGSEDKLKQDAIKHLFDVYVEISKEAEKNEELHDEARKYFLKMEQGDEEALSLWKKFRDLSIEKYKELYHRLNVSFDVYSGESFYEEGMKRSIQRLTEMNLLEDSRGAKIINLEDYKLGKPLIVKSDGASLYLTRDIAAAEGRFEDYHFDKMIYVVGAPQDLHLQQLFKILELSKLPFAKNCVHVNFGSVKGMSTRKGNVVFLEDIIEESKQAMLNVMKGNEEKFSQIQNPEETADILAVSAILVQDFSAKRIKDYDFNMERMTSFEGDTGPYLQYAHSRLCSIERKCNLSLNGEEDLGLLVEPEAFEVASLVARFPNVLQECLKTHEPCGLVTFLMALSHAVSHAWEKLWVLNQEQPKAAARLALYKAAQITLANGLSILGIRPLERM